MDAFEAEELKQQIENLLSEYASPRQKLLIIKDYYRRLLSSTSHIIAEAYINDFWDEFLNSLHKYEVFFFKPQLTTDIIHLLETLKQFYSVKEGIKELDDLIESLKIRLDQLFQILDGKDMALTQIRPKVSFPVLEEDKNNGGYNYLGALESFTIDIKKNNNEDAFIIIPISDKVRETLLSQIKISWELALNYIGKHFRRINKYHKVVIHFDRLLGDYTGSSFGAALTISFIEELIKFYNLSFVISIKDDIALTGGFNKNGNLALLDENIIEKKLEVIFYSYIKIFVVPENNKEQAIQKLKNLKQLYPKRNLKIIGITDLQDLLNRRNLIDIKKHNPIVRTAKYTKRNWVVSLLILALILITGYFYKINYDDNPAILDNQGQTLFVENKSGKVLYSKSFDYDTKNINNPFYIKNFQMLVDINNDGKKELLTAIELRSNLDNNKLGSITCYDYRGNQIWNYLFRDTISSPGEILSENYTNFIIDTTTISNKKVLVAYSQNNESFGSAIYMLDLKTGKRVFGTFWHPGFIEGGFIIDAKHGGEKQLMFDAWNNSWKRVAVGMLDLNDINGKAPSDNYHSYYNEKIAHLKNYILLPDEDYRQIVTPSRELFCSMGDFIKYGQNIKCIIFLNNINYGGIEYIIREDFKNINIVIDNDYALTRDSYVKSGKLKPPLSDTQAYRNLLKSQILYWNGSKFVRKKIKIAD